MRSNARSRHSPWVSRWPTGTVRFLLGCLVLGAGCGGGIQGASPAEAPPAEGASDTPPRPDRELHSRIDQDNLRGQLTPYVESIGAGFGRGYHAMGFVAVSGAGKSLYEHAFGYADIESKESISADTVFRVGGITKQLTAAATLLLANSGKLSLEERIGKYLPDYPKVGSAITLHELLSHTAGLPDYMNDPALRERMAEPHRPEQLLERFAALPLEFEPGSEFRQGESGYAVLGAIIERVSGQSYAQHMQRAVFERFGLAHTTLGNPSESSEVARGYSAAGDGGLVPARSVDASTLFAGGGASSTARDLLHWHDALQTGQVLSGKLEARFYRPVRSRYAYGWFVDERHGVGVLHHGGNMEGFSSHFGRVPELDLAIVVLCNNSSIDALPMFEAALRAALGEKVAPLEAGKGVPVDPSIPPRITGTYRLSDAAAEQLKERKISKKALQAMRSVRIYEENGTLFFRPVGQSAVPLIATGPGRFILLGGKAKIEVMLDPDDAPATRLTLEQGALHAEFTRRARVRGKAEEPEPKDEPAP